MDSNSRQSTPINSRTATANNAVPSIGKRSDTHQAEEALVSWQSDVPPRSRDLAPLSRRTTPVSLGCNSRQKALPRAWERLRLLQTNMQTKARRTIAPQSSQVGGIECRNVLKPSKFLISSREVAVISMLNYRTQLFVLDTRACLPLPSLLVN